MKRRGTRKEKIKVLLALIAKGPDYTFDTFGNLDLPEMCQLTKWQRESIQLVFETYTRIWLRSWVDPLARELLAKELD